jgi:hypothetical protein
MHNMDKCLQINWNILRTIIINYENLYSLSIKYVQIKYSLND